MVLAGALALLTHRIRDEVAKNLLDSADVNMEDEIALRCDSILGQHPEATLFICAKKNQFT